ncbi:hypothetical protein HC723_11805 [Vibrio sp. S11_S32]|uniref:hypothetical protein n=1 Tax=Vibrio sp. S11_S32 TaxID=2720225 RepID=UPI0016816696|nr:hypothetical protein [Vibrio sp. S11_S32]MBD1577117.1 hypothetical protein [Vibrio sp. S11_S32]
MSLIINAFSLKAVFRAYRSEFKKLTSGFSIVRLFKFLIKTILITLWLAALSSIWYFIAFAYVMLLAVAGYNKKPRRPANTKDKDLLLHPYDYKN